MKKTLGHFIVKAFLITVLAACNDGERKMKLIAEYERDLSDDLYHGELYVSLETDTVLDSAFLKRECLKIISTLDNNHFRVVKLNVMKDGQKVKVVQLINAPSGQIFRVFDMAEENRRANQAIDKVIRLGAWTKPEDLVGVWDANGFIFLSIYRERDSLKINTCTYKGLRVEEEFTYVHEVTLNGEKFFKHIWASDGSARFYHINEYCDLVCYEPQNFFQMVCNRIELEN